MFKKLKDKIAEEVKQSPLKSVQQLAQAVVSPSSSSVFEPSSSNDKFCIEEGDVEEDEKQEQVKPGGFTSVALTGQTTSPIRDQSQKHGFRSSSGSLMAEADNLFPKFEPQPTNFHVQSDWESASEVEDRYSQLEHINKESLYEAYRKVYNRYNRMKNKYHEVVTHYRQLEREKEKARTVLAETQDKALLRISELREQCLLEQQAKAHLEEALRNELEERDHIINTLKTKVQYLKGGESAAAEGLGVAAVSREEGNLIDFTDNSSVSAVPLPCDASNFDEQINWFEEKVNSLRILLNEETSKVKELKSQLEEATKRNCDFKDALEENVDNCEPSLLEKQTKNDLHKVLSGLITKLSTEVQNLQKNAVSCSILKSVNDRPNLELESTYRTNETGLVTSNVLDAQREEMDRLLRELEENNKDLNTITDALRKKIKISNENFGKNDAINCLITDVDHELIQEWNICFQNFLQTRCEITVLKDTRDDLEKEILRLKEEKNKFENMSKDLKEQNNKIKGDVEIMQRDLKSYLNQLEVLSKEKSDLKMSYDKVEKQIKKLQEKLSCNQKVQSETHEDLQKIVEEKSNVETKLASLESELQKTLSENLLLLETKQKMDDEMLTLRRENEEVIAEKESLNNKVNEMENKLKQVEEDYNMVLETRDGLDNQINSLTKLTEEFTSERNSTMVKISNLEKDLEQKNKEITLLHKEKEKLLQEIGHIKVENDFINNEKRSISEKLCELSKELEQNKKDYVKYLESTQERSDEAISLKKERDELVKEKNILQSEIEKLNKDNKVLNSNNSEAIEIKESLSKELLYVKEERNKLMLEIQSIQNRVLELDSASKSANEELLALKREHADLTSEKNNLQKEILRLQSCLESNVENYSSSSETIKELSNEIASLKKEREVLIKEKSTSEDILKKLDYDLSISKEELSTLTEEYSNVTDKLQVLQKHYEDIIMLKQNEQSNVTEMKNELTQKEELLSLVTEKNRQLTKDIEVLKDDYNHSEEECKLMKEKYNNAIAECENNSSVISSLTETNTKLQEENNQFKKESKHNYETKTLLDEERNTVSDLKGQLSSLSQSLEKKCEETNMKDKEILCLKTSSEKLSEKINELNSVIEKITQEKKVIFNVLLGNLDNVKIIKELQKSLYNFVKRFQVEVSQEINDINLKMGQDLLKHITDLLDHETSRNKFMETECKSKEDINSFNSKLKNLQGLSNIAEEVSQVKVSPLETGHSMENGSGSKMVKFSQMGHLERLSESDSSYSYNPEAHLKHAILLMKSFTNLLNHNSVNSDFSVDIFAPKNEKHIRLDEIDSNNLQKEIVAMESFITDFETKYSKSYSLCADIQRSNHSDYADEQSNTSEILLKQEIGLKDGIIKKLQSVIEEYELKKDVDDSEFVYKQKVHMLEEENKSLSNKLKQLQGTHELNVKNIVSEYEKRLEDIEEESNLYDFEKLGKEKNHVVNEMKEQIQNLQQDLEDRGDAFEKLYEEHQQSLKGFDEEIHQARNNHDKDLREQDKKWRQCLDRRLAEEESRHQQELATLNMQWNAERRELETARRLALNALESGSSSNDMLRIQVQALEMQMNELRNNRCEACKLKRKNEKGQDPGSKSIQDCTEMEYLRNILYEYMMGKEPLVLAKVLCALVKFDENQTKEIVSKEEHRITLFGQLGLL